MLGMNTFLKKSSIRLRQQLAVLAPLSASLLASLWAPLLLAIAVAAPGMAAADPLHSVKGSLLWRHEFSGWLFPTDVAGLQREGFPYQLDGGDSAGVEYAAPGGAGIELEIQVLLGTDLPAPMEGVPYAPTTATDKQGTRVATVENGKLLVRYLVFWQAWAVRIIAKVPADTENAAAKLDAAVDALSWGSLGASERLH
jgi:hypothetical protein